MNVSRQVNHTILSRSAHAFYIELHLFNNSSWAELDSSASAIELVSKAGHTKGEHTLLVDWKHSKPGTAVSQAESILRESLDSKFFKERER